MSEYEHFIRHSEDMVCNNPAEEDDVTVVLAVLQGLADRCSRPVVRACLEQAYDDILHLASHGNAMRDDDDDSAVAE